MVLGCLRVVVDVFEVVVGGFRSFHVLVLMQLVQFCDVGVNPFGHSLCPHVEHMSLIGHIVFRCTEFLELANHYFYLHQLSFTETKCIEDFQCLCSGNCLQGRTLLLLWFLVEACCVQMQPKLLDLSSPIFCYIPFEC